MKLVYRFRQNNAEGTMGMADTLGGKGANLAEMCLAGLPIPLGVTIPTDACVQYMGVTSHQTKKALVVKYSDAAFFAINEMTADEPYRPLFSVRSGARVSMPGMMDTVLNVGLSVNNISEYRKNLGDRVALDSFRRLIQMYANVVHSLPNEFFEKKLDEIRSYKYGMDEPPKTDADLSVTHLEKLVDAYLDMYEMYIGEAFPTDLLEQLGACIEAVWLSWNSDRAKKYRKHNNIPDDWGTAVNIQKMVFGNKNDDSCSGVLFTRDPGTGEEYLYGEFLPNAQGEDVVAGIRTPLRIHEGGMAKWNGGQKILTQLTEIAKGMEKHYGDMQDMEFTVEDGELFILQTRSGKRSAAAAFKIAHDMALEGLITKKEAIKRVSGKQYMVLHKPQIDPSYNVEPDFKGIPAAGSVVSGVAVLTSENAQASKEPCILVRQETTPEDFPGMVASIGILTTTGGSTSHAAVVARGMDKTCVVGCADLDVSAGDKITMDGRTGRVWVNKEVPVIKSKIDKHVREIISWALADQKEDTIIKIGLNSVEKDEPAVWLKDYEEQLPEKGRVYIDCSKMDTKFARYKMAKLIDVLKSRPGLSGVLGLVSEPAPTEDNEFLDCLCLSQKDLVSDDAAMLASHMKALALKKCTLELKNRWALHLPPCCTALQDEELALHKWQRVRRVTNMGELLKVDGLLDIDDNTKNMLAEQGVDLQEMVAILKAAGRKVEPMPRTVSKARMIFDALG